MREVPMREAYKEWLKTTHGIDITEAFNSGIATEMHVIASLIKNGQKKMAEHRLKNLYEAYIQRNPDKTMDDMIEELTLKTIKSHEKAESALKEENELSDMVIFNIDKVR